MVKDFFVVVSKKVSGIIKTDLEVNDTQSELESKIKTQITSILKLKSTIIITHPGTGDYVIKNDERNVTFIVRIGSNRILTSSRGIVDNATYSSITIEAIKNMCNHRLEDIFNTYENDVQNSRFNNLDVLDEILVNDDILDIKLKSN